VTLPVEYDASNRLWLVRKQKNAYASRTGWSQRFSKMAARTYVVAALGIATLLYYISIYMGGRRD
jgi:Zn-dependent membrane protease YugP